MTATVEMLARARAAQYVEELLDVLAVMTDKMQLEDFRREQSERITNGVIEIYHGAKRDARETRGVIGSISHDT